MRFVTAAVLAAVMLWMPVEGAAQDNKASDQTGAGLAQVDPSLLGGMVARSIGPAGMSGRIGAIDAVEADPTTIWVGTAAGGVWKSTNGATTWTPVFDEQAVSSIGAVAIFQPSPDIVWVGTGEGAPRNSVGAGNGIYRTLDGGTTWEHLGLESSERIARIVLDPQNPEIAYVAAMGPAWSEGTERGVFKTNDGGETWTRVLYVDERTGAADLTMDPANPLKLFAAMWQYRRWPWVMASGGPGSGLYVTYDGGATWDRFTTEDGMPPGNLGRIGVAIARSNPRVVYAIVEAATSALLRSDDGGQSWKTVNASPGISSRPFYYSQVRVDPENENRIYNLGSRMRVSDDGGQRFSTVAASGPVAGRSPGAAGTAVHPDHHALWIAPSDPRLLINGSDGGVAISRDRGQTWWFVDNLPLSQFYHITVDMEIPYNVYGGMQDNSSWRGPGEVWEMTGLGLGGAKAGIRNYAWTDIGFDLDDGFNALSDPEDARFAYALSQGGRLRRIDLVTGERKDILPPVPDNVELRLNWDAASALDPLDPAVIYLGSQFVHRSGDRGKTWKTISPDLTSDEAVNYQDAPGVTNDPETYGSILTIAPSPVERGVIWVGTDDGNVQITRDRGDSWTNVTRNVPSVPPGTWVPHIEPSEFKAGAAFVVFDDHRRGNWTPYIYGTLDYGQTWRSLVTNDLWGYAHTLEQDPINGDLLFLGTEFGLYVSVDAGESWFKWKNGLPTVPVRGLVVHPRDYDLVIGTHGRGAYILDDIRPLRGLTSELLESPLHLFEIPPAQQHALKQPHGYPMASDAMFRGESRAYGAPITYVTNPSSESVDAVVTVIDSAGAVLRTMRSPAKRGMNRIVWDLRRDLFRIPTPPTEQGPAEGAELPAGRYTVRVSVGDHQASQSVLIRPDLRNTISAEIRAIKFEAVMRTGFRMEVIGEALERIRNTRTEIQEFLDESTTRNDPTSAEFVREGQALDSTLGQLSIALLGSRSQPSPLRKLRYVYSALTSSWEQPTEAELTYLRQAETSLTKALQKLNKIYETEVATFRHRVEAGGLGQFSGYEPLDLDWKRKSSR